jgi:hypothetical protein
MRSHFMLGRGLAVACAATGAVTVPAAVSSGQIAADNASDPAYADGWQAGDNGGFGFGPWDMTGTANSAVQHAIDSTSPYNQIGTAWTLFNPNAGPPGPGFTDNPNPPQAGTDLSQAGRAITGGLLPFQTISVVIDNPIERRFFRGYTVRLNTGGGNTVYQGTPMSRLAIGTFEYSTNGAWYASGSGGDPNLFDTDTDAGMRIDVTLTSADTFSLVMTPLDNPSRAYTKSGNLEPGGPIDWIELEMYNTDSDFFPTPAEGGQSATDFYIRSITIVPEPSAALGVLAGGFALALRRRRRNT